MDVKKTDFVISDQTFDRREDIYAFSEFGKVVNRYVLNDQMYSSDFWNYIKNELVIKKENITVFCDIRSDVKNRTEKMYKYIIKIDKPFKIIIQFYDEEKVIDNKIYESDEEQRNKITELMIHFDYDATEYVDKIIEDLKNVVYLPSINKTFFIISA